MNPGQDDFISQYLSYTENTEPPAIYHRWSIITAIAAYLERSYYFQHGHSKIYPNLYVMLVGSAGTRKNTAINLAKNLLKATGYSTIAASKTSKEKFFLDLAEQNSSGNPADDILDQNLFGQTEESGSVTPCYIASGEFNTFFGNNILDFLADLGELWDYEGIFDSRIKSGKSVYISNPTITMIGGNTPATLANTFPPQIIGQGFFSRLLMIWGYRTREKITFPKEPDAILTTELVKFLKAMKPPVQTKVEMDKEAEELLDSIYKSAGSINDPRFDSYYNRRFAQLIKLCIICMCASGFTKINRIVVMYANTILVHAENFMAKALGEFGLAKNSEVTHKVLSIIQDADGPVRLKQIWEVVSTDLENVQKLGEILKNLQEADKIQVVPEFGFLPKKKAIDDSMGEFIDYRMLTMEERLMKV